MRKLNKVIVTSATTGAIHLPCQSPHLPITPEQIIEDSLEAVRQGASIIHLHARDPETGMPTTDPEVYKMYCSEIADRSGAIINITTGQPEEAFEGYIDASYETELDGFGITGMVTGPLSDNVRGRLYRLTPADGTWNREEIQLPGLGRVRITASSDDNEIWFYSYTDFLTPSSLFLVAEGKSEQVKSMPAFFDADGMEVVQREATSKDGTKIPYFLITPSGFKADGKAPALLYGYGGFEISMTPRYSAIAGTAWLEQRTALGLYTLESLSDA